MVRALFISLPFDRTQKTVCSICFKKAKLTLVSETNYIEQLGTWPNWQILEKISTKLIDT